MRYLYSLMALVYLPFALLKLLIRGTRDRRYLYGWSQRLGFPAGVEGNPIWIHAVSVGEVRAVSPLIYRLLERYPDKPLHLSTTTPTGAQMVSQLFKGRVKHSYAPYDVPVIVSRYLHLLKPSLVIIVETEIWPNLFHICNTKDVPLCLINARLSPKSLQRYQLVRPLIRDALNKTAFISAKSKQDSERLIELGVAENKVKNIGNIKFDVDLNTKNEGVVRQLKTLTRPYAPVWIAASTHEGEEKLVFDAHVAIREVYPNTLLILVPRHPERARDLMRRCDKRGLQFTLTSDLNQITGDCSVVICDQLGMLIALYQVADIAYIGGSLVEHGGHNPLEPAMFQVPILTGPHTWNFNDVYPLLYSTNAALLVNSSKALTDEVMLLAENRDLRQEMGIAAFNLVNQNKGATDNIADLLDEYIK